MKVIYSVRSHKGNIREKNEDNFFANGITLVAEYENMAFSIDACAFSPLVLAVCDGMIFTLREYPVVYGGSLLARILQPGGGEES